MTVFGEAGLDFSEDTMSQVSWPHIWWANQIGKEATLIISGNVIIHYIFEKLCSHINYGMRYA